MAVYKEGKNYVAKVCIHNKQIYRRKYLGRTMKTIEQAKDCERDLYLEFGDAQKDYHINDLFGVYEEYLYKRYKETSARRYMYSFNCRIKKYFVNRDVSNITRSYLVFVNDSINRQAYKDIEHLICLCKQFIVFLSDYGCKTSTNPLFEFRKNKINRHKFDFYSYDEFLKFNSVIDDITYKFISVLFYYYGLRMGELRALHVYDFKNDRVVVDKELTSKGRLGGQRLLDPKTNSSNRYYPYVKNIRELFLEIVKVKHLGVNDFVFKGRNGAIGERTIADHILFYSKKAGLKYITPHSFRHSCVSYLYNNNIDIKDISAWIGHSSINVTLRTYAHLLPVRKDNVANYINNVKK